MKNIGLAIAVASLTILAGCGDGYYCQSGAKYGTQCHQKTNTEWRSDGPTKGRTDWRPKKRSTTPATAPR